MFGIFRKKFTNYSSTVVIYCGIGMNQFMPLRIEHSANDWIEERSNTFPNPNQHNLSTQNTAYIKHNYKPLKRQTKIFRNVEKRTPITRES